MFFEYPQYVSVAERRQKALKCIQELKKKNIDINPVQLDGKRKIAKTWWGMAWNNNLERYSDYENRIGRGRSYVRHNAVVDLKITKGNIHALVHGSSSKPYKLNIAINSIKDKEHKKIIKSCKGKLDSMQELIEGKFPEELKELFTKQGSGLFPTPSEISFNCNCPDGAYMCKHIAAALYGVGARLDEEPTLFFTLRNINIEELISEAITEKTQVILKKSKRTSKRVLDNNDLSDMFDIDIS